jgi:hypothetical protein
MLVYQRVYKDWEKHQKKNINASKKNINASKKNINASKKK